MASLFEKPRSPFWWVNYRDPETGLIKRESTGFRVGVGAQTRQAREFAAQKSLEEAKSGRGAGGSAVKQRWDRWVPDFLRVRYGDRSRFEIGWDTMKLFLAEQKITLPRQLNRGHCMAYLAWRQKPDVAGGKYKASLNTALLEVKVLGIVMKEAVLRGYAPFNPCRELGVKREKGREKPEYTEEDLAIIEKAIEAEPEPLRTFYANSFLIARYQGCRLSETHLNPLTQVDLVNRTIAFDAKGGRTHVAPLHRKVVPLMERLIMEQRTETYALPKSPAKMWWGLLTRCGMKARKPGACFHSLRVTAATRLARSRNVTEAKAMKYLGHASTTVHRTYQRLRAEDLGDCESAMD